MTDTNASTDANTTPTGAVAGIATPMAIESPTPLAAGMSSAPSTGSENSPEFVAMLKKQLEEKTTQVANLRVFKDAYDSRNRDYMPSTQAAALEYTKDLPATVSEHNQQYVGSLQRIAEGKASTHAETLEEHMPLAILVDCASADKKRARDAESQLADSASALKEANQKVDEERQEKEKFVKYASEMEALANERQQQAEEMAMRYAQITGTMRRGDFSLQASRAVARPTPPSSATPTTPAGAPAVMATGLAAGERVDVAPPAMTATLDVASGGKARMRNIDPTTALSAFVNQQGLGSSRIMRNQGTHGILGGAADGAPSSSGASAGSYDLAAAIRAHL